VQATPWARHRNGRGRPLALLLLSLPALLRHDVSTAPATTSDPSLNHASPRRPCESGLLRRRRRHITRPDSTQRGRVGRGVAGRSLSTPAATVRSPRLTVGLCGPRGSLPPGSGLNAPRACDSFADRVQLALSSERGIRCGGSTVVGHWTRRQPTFRHDRDRHGGSTSIAPGGRPEGRLKHGRTPWTAPDLLSAMFAPRPHDPGSPALPTGLEHTVPSDSLPRDPERARSF
jgi:hypothetical protein